MKQGICTKCGKQGKVVMHHAHGYDGENKDNVAPYCVSCHVLIHKEARKSGRCKISTQDLHRLSLKSALRRQHKDKCVNLNYSETLMKHIALREIIEVWPNTIYYRSFFHAQNGKKIYEINI